MIEPDAARIEQVSSALAQVRQRIADACCAAGRSVDDVRLLAVTKTFPVSDVVILSDLGLTDFAEARDQEAAPKVAEFAAARPAATACWHAVGRLQRNKARSVVRWADRVQSVDSHRLADALARAARSAIDAGERDTPLEVSVQVSLDDDPERGGCSRGDVLDLAEHIAAARGVSLRGVMAVAPLGVAPAEAFTRLADVARQVRERHPNAVELSAGMSGDLSTAIEWGSTCVRVGTALLGGRPLASG